VLQTDPILIFGYLILFQIYKIYRLY